MATVEKTVSILFLGEDQLSDKVKNIQKTIGSFTGSVESLAAPLAGVADGILKTDAALMALAIGGLAYAFTKSSEFETAVIELEKVLGDQPEALEAARKAAFDLSRQYGESSSAILLSTANFKQAGFDIVDSIMLTKNAMDLSIAGSVESSEASELLVATLKGFKEPATEAARLVDILNEVSNRYATNVHELGIGMAELSPIANLMGFSFEETAGILTPVIEIFRSGEEAATSLKMGLLKLVDDSKPVKDALAALGVAQLDANGHLRSGKDILYDVAEAFQTAEKNDKLFLAAQLVGIRQAGKMVEVFDGLAKTTEITSVAMGAAGSATLEVAARLKSSEVVVDRFIEGFKNLSIVVGDQFKTAAKEAVDGGTAIENALEDIIKDGTFKPVFDALSNFGVEIGDYLKKIAKAMPKAFEGVNFDNLLDAFGDIGEEMKSIFDGLDLTKPEDLQTAIQFVVDSLETLVRVTEGMVEVFKPVLLNLFEMSKGLNAVDDETKKSAGNILGLAKAITDLGAVFLSVTLLLGENAKAIEAAFTIVINSISFLWETAVITIKGIQFVFFELVKASLELADIFTLGLSDTIKKNIIAVEQFQDSLKKDIIASYGKQVEDVSGILGLFADETKETGEAIKALPEKTVIEIEAKVSDEKFEAFRDSISELPEWTQVELLVAFNKGDLDEVDRILSEVASDKEITFDKTASTANAKNVASTVGKTVDEVLDEAIPSEKLLEIKLKGEIDTEIARIKAVAETVQTVVEWSAKLDIAEVEANAKIMEAVFEGIAVTMESTGNVLSGLFGIWAGADHWSEQGEIKRWIEEEYEMRKEAHNMQMELNEAQLDYMEARAERIEKGEEIFKIKAEGLQPHLEAIMWEVLEKVQIQVVEEKDSFLLGIGSD